MAEVLPLEDEILTVFMFIPSDRKIPLSSAVDQHSRASNVSSLHAPILSPPRPPSVPIAIDEQFRDGEEGVDNDGGTSSPPAIVAAAAEAETPLPHCELHEPTDAVGEKTSKNVAVDESLVVEHSPLRNPKDRLDVDNSHTYSAQDESISGNNVHSDSARRIDTLSPLPHTALSSSSVQRVMDTPFGYISVRT
jgi:hypothetical protein